MGYGTGATLKATTDAYNEGVLRNESLARSEQERELAVKRDARAERQESREQQRFGMQTELYERQTRLFNDQQEREKLLRELNRGMATLKATGGQVYQPLIDTYNNLMPDGGRINAMTRNPDGTFSVEYDHGGRRMNLDNQSLEEVGSFFMSMANPEGFLNTQREIAAQAAEAAAAERLERLKASLKNKATPAQYARAYKEYSEIYDKAYTAGDGLGGPGEALPGAPPREQWINSRLSEAGFTAGGGGGAIPGPGGDDDKRKKAIDAMMDAFSSTPRWREWMREGGLPVEKLAETQGGAARWAELEDAMTGNDEESLKVLEKHIREMAGRLGVADITDEEIAMIIGNRKVVPTGPPPPPPAEAPPQAGVVPPQAGAAPQQPAYTPPQAGQGWNQLMGWRERNQAARDEYIQNYNQLGQQGVVPAPQVAERR